MKKIKISPFILAIAATFALSSCASVREKIPFMRDKDEGGSKAQKDGRIAVLGIDNEIKVDEVTKDIQVTIPEAIDVAAVSYTHLDVYKRQIPQAGLEPDGNLIWTYKEALVPNTMPKRLLVIGSGAIGIEFASFFKALGAEVTVVEALDRVMPVEDKEISDFAAKQFKKRGMHILTSANVKGLKKTATEVTATIETVSYTHLDVYKRQVLRLCSRP